MMPWKIKEFFGGRPSGRPTVPEKAAANGKRNSNDPSSLYFGGSNISSSSSGGGVGAPSRGKSGNSLISSALWAIARTPALVEAVERVEANDSDDPCLSPVLRALKPADLSDPSSLRRAGQAAEAFLQANQRKVSVYDDIQPMEAIRAILGICGDSTQVFKETVETTYRTNMQCQYQNCRFTTDAVEVREENLRCANRKAQLAMEIRASSTSRTDICVKCKGKRAAKRYAVKRAAPCFVATWSALARSDPGQDTLVIRTTGETLRFRLSVVIAAHKSKFVCMFSEGNNYFRVEGHSVKLITKAEWQNVQPCLALFTRQASSSSGHVSARGSSKGLPHFSPGGGEKAGRKRRREENGGAYFPGGGGGSNSCNGTCQGSAVAEVISIDDDDDESDADHFEIPAGCHDPGDRATGGSGSGRVGGGGRENGSRVGGCGGKEEGGKLAPGGGNGGPEIQRSQVEALGVEDDVDGVDRMDVAGEQVRGVDKFATGVVAENGGWHTGASASSRNPAATATPKMAAPAPTRARDTSAARDSRGEDLSPVVGSRDEPCRLRRSGSPADGSAPDAWMRQGEDSSGRSSSGGGGGGGSSRMPTGDATSPRGQRLRVGGILDRDSQSGHKGSAAIGVDDSNVDEADDDDDEVELVRKGQSCVVRGDEGAGSSAAKAASSAMSSKLSKPRTDHGTASSSSYSSGWMQRRRPPNSPSRAAEKDDDNCVAVATGTSSGGSLDSSPSQRQQRRSSPGSRNLQVHDLVDDDDSSAASLLLAPREGTRHPNGIAMPFIGPTTPPATAGGAVPPFIGPARPPAHQSKLSLPPRPQPQAAVSGSQWLTSKTKPSSDASRTQIRRKFPPSAASTAVAKAGSRSGAAKGLEEGQGTMTASWGGKKGAPSSGTPTSGGGGGRRSRGSSGDPDDDDEWRPTGKDATPAGSGGTGSNSESGGGFGEGKGGGSNGREGLRSRRRQKMTEDLTGADGSWQGTGDGKSGSGGFGGGRREKRLAGGGMPDDVTLTTIRGINLQQDHFERIVDSDGWLTSQIIDIRVKQLQDFYPQHLYFDSSFFGFLCPKTEKGGAFVVDYERVAGWTKRSRLPGGKSSLFDMRKLFIPINQGNIHWVLVVVDMGGGSGSGAKMVVSFFDSFGRDGTAYVEAVQQYLVSELSSRDKTRQGLFAPRPRPPANAPRQHNSSDCGVLMLHVMEQLSCAPVDVLERLTQDEIMSLRLQLVAKIRE